MKKKFIVPTFCFAVLASGALEEKISAASISAEQKLEIRYVDISSGTLNMRKSGSTNASVVASLKKGTKVSVYSESSGWAKIKADGKTGYVSTKYLSSTKSGAVKQAVPTATKYVKVSSGTLNMRKSGSTSASVVSKLKNGTKVTYYSASNGWAKIKADGKTGYVSTKYLSSTKSGAVKQAVTTATKYVKVSSGTLNMRKSGSTSASVVAKLKNGTKVTYYSASNGWAKIKADGKTGYVSTKYLTATKPVTTVKTSTKYISVSSGTLTMRKSGSTGASVVLKLKNGTKVTYYSATNGWAKIKADGKTGYVSTKYLTATKPVTAVKTSTKYVSVSSGTLTMRKSGSTSASVVAKLKNGTKVTYYSASNGWAKIKANGITGYVSTKYLTATKPGTAKKESEPTKTVTKYVKVNSGNLNVRKSALTTAAIVASLKNGTKVEVQSESNGWAKIKADGVTGYVSTAYLSTGKQEVQKAVTKYVNVSSGSLNMRNKPSENASIIVKLAKGVEVEVLSEADGWAHIKAYGGEGYVSSKYLSKVKPGTAETPLPEEETVVKFVKVSDGSALNLRSEANTASAIVAKLENNTAVTVFSEENGWARVTVNGKTGYVSSEYLSNTEAGTGTTGKTVSKTYTDINLTIAKMVELQMNVDAQTDQKYQTYIREDALILTSSTKGTVSGTGWRVRGGAGPENWVVSTVSNNQSLTILSKVKGSDGYYWYQVDLNKGWVNASPDDVKYYVDPDNFADDPVYSYQFIKLSQATSLNASEVNSRILSGKGILEGKASSFIQGGTKYGVNEMYLIAHALLETGNGTSPLATGVKVNGKTVYNMYGIGAYDGTALESGAQYAYNAGWFTPEAAIIGGAEFIAKGYISAGQDTLYKMRWNPTAAAQYGYATHQYASDIGWASKQVNQIYNLYNLLDSYTLMLDIPKYKS